jgi:uncharacterized membrane protein YcjF (UPF0283 family)
MKITRDVITDLLPLYDAGEASPDTRSLVEAYLRDDPEFARLVLAQKTPLAEPQQPALSQGVEMETLRKTRSLLKKRTYFMAFAIVFSLSAFSFSFGPQGVRWLWSETPILSLAFLVAGILFWSLYARTARSLQGSDL